MLREEGIRVHIQEECASLRGGASDVAFVSAWLSMI